MEGIEEQSQGAAYDNNTAPGEAPGTANSEDVEPFCQFLLFREEMRGKTQQEQPVPNQPYSGGLESGFGTNSFLKKKESPWPKWDGTVENFGFYATQVEAKIDEDRHLLGNDRFVCLGMISTLPESSEPRVGHWFQSVDPLEVYRCTYDWRLFLAHGCELFEDWQDQQTAGKQLSRMRQDTHQSFESFLHDFEYKLAQCGGSGWADSLQIIPLNNVHLQCRLSVEDR